MKLLIEPFNEDCLYENVVDGLILPLENFAVQSECYFSLEDIKNIILNNPNLEIFVSVNKNIQNNEIDDLKSILVELDKLNVKGIMFYDISLLKIKRDLNLNVNLVWNQTYMVNNYKTCDYYFSKGVKYAYLSKEITLNEVIDIIKNSKITSMVEVLGFPSVAFSKRKLLTNFYSDLKMEKKDKLNVFEKVSKEEYQIEEDSNGTNFLLKSLVNGTSIIKDLYNASCPYIIMKGYGIEENVFSNLLKDTKSYILDECNSTDYVNKYKFLGDNTNFFFKKTVYQVKKDE